MIWVVAFILLTGSLMAVCIWRGDHERGAAFLFILLGLVLMALLRGAAHGWLAFAVWTLISYLLLNFPLASTLYLGSAFGYVVALIGWHVVAVQVASNVTGLMGLAAVWYGRPKWRYVGDNRAGPWGFVALASDVARGRATIAARKEPKK